MSVSRRCVDPLPGSFLHRRCPSSDIFHSGEAEYKAAQAKGYAEGLQDQVTGYVQRIYLGLVHRLTNPCSYVKNIGGALTGDNTQQAEGESLSPAQLMTG